MSKLYSTKDAFDLYMYYLALKRHFTSDYDFFKYQGKVKANVQSFENRKDKFFFYKLSKRKEAKDILLANLLEAPNMWIGDIFDDRAETRYTEWLKRQQSLTYMFKKEINLLTDDMESDIVVENGQHPKLLRLYTTGNISIETLIILNDVIKFFGYWNKNISDTIIWPDINKKCKKYRPFLEYDLEKLRKIVLDKHAKIH
jgi:hypothetical protein